MAGDAIDFTLRLSLREGSLYYFTERSLTSPEPHYFLVVNSDPISQKVLLLAVVTSKVEKVKLRRKSSPETLVELGPADLPNILKVPSIVDCNDLKEISLEEFNSRFTKKEFHYFGKDLAPAQRKALRAAVHASAVVEAAYKSLVAPP